MAIDIRIDDMLVSLMHVNQLVESRHDARIEDDAM